MVARAGGTTAEVAGKAAKAGGRGVQAAGTAAQAAGMGARAAGGVGKVAGKSAQAVGKGLSAAGDALNATKIGAIAGIPLKALGLGSQAAGKGTEAAGKGVGAAGKTVQKAGEKAKKAGQKMRDAGEIGEELGEAVKEESAAHRSRDAEGLADPASTAGKDRGQRLDDTAKNDIGDASGGNEKRKTGRQAMLQNPSGMTTRDKRTGEIKEGIGGASSEEAARQNIERRTQRASDEAAMQNIQRRSRKPSDEAAEQNIERRQRLTPGGTLRARRRRGRRGEEDGGDPRKPSKLGKDEEFPAGKPAESSKEMEAFMRKWMGAMWLRTLWSWLWPSFGHTIYLINLTFASRLLSGYFRRWVPEVGSEWFYISPAMRVGVKGKAQKGRSSKASRAGSKAGIMVVKAGELIAMAFITFIVAMMDIFVIIVIILIVLTVQKIIDIIPGI